MPFVTTWMDLEGVVLNEISQRQTNIIDHLQVETGKDDANELIYKTEID